MYCIVIKKKIEELNKQQLTSALTEIIEVHKIVSKHCDVEIEKYKTSDEGELLTHKIIVNICYNNEKYYIFGLKRKEYYYDGDCHTATTIDVKGFDIITEGHFTEYIDMKAKKTIR